MLKYILNILVIFLFTTNLFSQIILNNNILIKNNVAISPSFTGFKTEWQVSIATGLSITLPLYNQGVYNCTVSWGDGTSSTITEYNDSNRIHTYSQEGTYIVEIKGDCPGWSFNNTGDKAKIINVLSWGDIECFSGFLYLQNGFRGCSNLQSLASGGILFKTGYTTNLSFCFSSCANLMSVPEDLFKYGPLITNFSFCFSSAHLISLPADLFRYNVLATNFSSCFSTCPDLISLPADLFRYNVLATNFGNCFAGIPALILPADLFRYNTAATTFSGTFKSSKVTSVPADFFRYNTNATTFYQCFQNCNDLTLNPNIFYADGEQATRFLNKSVGFTFCFARTTFTGIQGTAPDLWNCNFGTGTVGTADCFDGAGNSLTSISNYNDIPIAWL